MTPSPRTAHERTCRELYHALWGFVRDRKLGEVFDAPYDVHLPSGDIVQPDLLFIKTSNAGIIQDWVRGVPDLVVEITSPEHPERDLVVKRAIYAKNGVGEYWIVDPAARAIEILSLISGAYTPHGYFEAADVLTSPSLPDFSLPLAAIFTAQ